MGKPTNYPDPNKNPYRVNKEQIREPSQARFTKPSVDFENQRVCPSCGILWNRFSWYTTSWIFR